MDEVTLAKESYQLARKDFRLVEEMEFGQGENEFDRLEDFLTKQVSYLLDHNINALLNALYRIDVPENKVKNLLHGSQPDEITRQIAKTIIEREKQKILTRRQYRPS